MSELTDKLKSYTKILVVVGILALIGLGIKQGIMSLYKQASDIPTYPTDPAVTAANFFDAMNKEDYQACYRLLTTERKSATGVGMQNREAYFRHFRRIRAYLTQCIGQDFLAKMVVSPDGLHAAFDNYIVLTLDYETLVSLDKKNHYALKEILEFPIDVMPGMGVEKYSRQLSRAVESLGTVSPEAQADDPAEIIQNRPDESASERLNRLISAYKNARQLDTKHAVLEWLLKEFPADPATQEFLNQLSKDTAAPNHLRYIAQNALAKSNRRR